MVARSLVEDPLRNNDPWKTYEKTDVVAKAAKDTRAQEPGVPEEEASTEGPVKSVEKDGTP